MEQYTSAEMGEAAYFLSETFGIGRPENEGDINTVPEKLRGVHTLSELRILLDSVQKSSKIIDSH